ncbi:hypothetical protein BTO04_14720 [Polaribacter sp. SA4-10]|uniref:T9SS type A sorting domain-containing protein n=1 Tax=Polaribacter sp. SA4-10 TaxID=754397 RepID=UPI000B3D3054|nr:T9SS type A sorting domain-containing protein [Polaribacter sp. SA4-10]ARV07870.1 hypothetical protein BTO04_14720 [Polaribacter sp. SA4-10]
MKRKIIYLLFSTFLLLNSINLQAQSTWTGNGTAGAFPNVIPDPSYNNAGNWNTDVPGSIDNIIINTLTLPNTNYPQVEGADNIVFNNMTINGTATFTLADGTVTSNGAVIITSTATLTLEAGTAFTATGSVASSGTITVPSTATFTLESDASLTTDNAIDGDGTGDGVITYKRNILDTNWHLISSPVSGQSIQGIKDNVNVATNGNNVGLASYLNSGPVPYVYEKVDETNSNPLTTGKGYSILLTSAGDVSFTGAPNTTSQTISVTQGTGFPNPVARNDYFLVGNPFTAYMDGKLLLNANYNTNGDGSSRLKSPTMWLYNGTQYITKNSAESFQLVPGQGFFIEVENDGLMDFDVANLGVLSSGTFTREEATSSFELFIENKNTKSAAKVFYIDGKTTGYDNGYDSKMFGGDSYSFAVFTELVSDNKGKHLAIQTLPKNDASIIPVGIIANKGEEITFSIESTNLPEGVSVSLEDKSTGDFTNLSESTYTTILTEAANGIGQFYIHTAGKSLNTTNLNAKDISVYKSSSNEITITGLNTDATFTMFSLLGKQVLQTKVTANGVHKVSLPSLSTGIYIVKLNSSLGTITKKITLNQQ